MGSACSSDTVVDKAGCDGHEHGRAAQKPQSRSEQYQQPHTARNYWHWTSASNTATPRGRRDGHGSAPTTPSDLPISADTFDAPPMFIDRGYVKPKAGGSSGRGATSIHDFVVRTRDGTGFDLGRCRGGPALVVNVAGRCDLAQSSFEAMAELHDRFARAGLAVLAFPCDQFGHHGQRGPGGAAGAQQSVAEATRVAREDDQLAAHVARVYLARFPVFARVDVTGADTEPLFRYLVDHAPEGALGAGLTYPGVTWNFTAFLCDGAGRVVRRYEPGVSVAEVEADLVEVLTPRSCQRQPNASSPYGLKPVPSFTQVPTSARSASAAEGGSCLPGSVDSFCSEAQSLASSATVPPRFTGAAAPSPRATAPPASPIGNAPLVFLMNTMGPHGSVFL